MHTNNINNKHGCEYKSGEGKNNHSNKRLFIILIIFIVAMFGFGFLLVPIYNSLCKNLGINGKTNSVADIYKPTAATIDTSRKVTVELLATNNAGLHWKFYPETKKITIHPGQLANLKFYAKNDTDHTMTVQAIPSVSPGIAAKYLKKTECFCFIQQTFKPHEELHMPLIFHLEKALPKDIKIVTLAYTLFDVGAHTNHPNIN